MITALNYIRVVLVEPTHPGNIGAVARAMANMGVSRLDLVRPQQFPSEIATARAAGAGLLLENARVFDNLDDAIADCTLVFATTARNRSINWHSLNPQQAMRLALIECEKKHNNVCATAEACASIAILFGRESRGLTNAELDRCHHKIKIPVNDEFSSLNLSAAVTVLLYELRKQALGDFAGDFVGDSAADSAGDCNADSNVEMASAADMQGFFQHLQTVLIDIEFTDGRSPKLMRKISRLFNRIRPLREEVNILRGILSSMQRALGKDTVGKDKGGKK